MHPVEGGLVKACLLSHSFRCCLLVCTAAGGQASNPYAKMQADNPYAVSMALVSVDTASDKMNAQQSAFYVCDECQA